MKRLTKPEVVVITGASSRVGLAGARAFARARALALVCWPGGVMGYKPHAVSRSGAQPLDAFALMRQAFDSGAMAYDMFSAIKG